MRDREAIEKMRLKERSGGYHHYEDIKSVVGADPNSHLYIGESERFDKDFAVEDRRRREEEYNRRQQVINAQRDQVIQREIGRWQSMEEQDRREQSRLDAKQASWKEGQKNKPSAAYNPITLEYDASDQGASLRQADEQIRQRAGQRMAHLDSRMNSGFNVLTGAPRYERR